MQDAVLTPDALVPIGVAAALFLGGIGLSIKIVRLWDRMSYRITKIEGELQHIEKMIEKHLGDEGTG